jgi:hypothetical protein
MAGAGELRVEGLTDRFRRLFQAEGASGQQQKKGSKGEEKHLFHTFRGFRKIGKRDFWAVTNPEMGIKILLQLIFSLEGNGLRVYLCIIIRRTC